MDLVVMQIQFYGGCGKSVFDGVLVFVVDSLVVFFRGGTSVYFVTGGGAVAENCLMLFNTVIDNTY